MDATETARMNGRTSTKKMSAELTTQNLDVVTELPVGRRSARPTAAIAVEDQLMTMHQSALRIRGVLHLLHEALQSGNGIDSTHAAAVCALIKGAEKDLGAVDKSIDALVDAHLDRSRR